MDLLFLVGEYALERELAHRSEKALRFSVLRFNEWLRRDGSTDDLNRETASRWVQAMQAEELAPDTVHGHRANLLTIWRYAANNYGLPHPDRVRKVRKPPPQPIAWTREEFDRLIAAARSLPGICPQSETRRSDYFLALLTAAYDTGLRKGDLEAIRREWISATGRIYLRQSKTRHVHVAQVRAVTMRRMLSLPGDCPLRWPGGGSSFYRAWKRIRQAAEVTNDGGLHKIRKCGASYVAKVHGMAAAQKFLGHQTASMVRHYVDPTIANETPIMPPPIKD